METVTSLSRVGEVVENCFECCHGFASQDLQPKSIHCAEGNIGEFLSEAGEALAAW